MTAYLVSKPMSSHQADTSSSHGYGFFDRQSEVAPSSPARKHAQLPRPRVARVPRNAAFLARGFDVLLKNPIDSIFKSAGSSSDAFAYVVNSKIFRPNIHTSSTRIEWICSCGDHLYGDFRERSPGSLQSLAARLGGSIINDQTLAAGTPSSNTSPSPLPQAHLSPNGSFFDSQTLPQGATTTDLKESGPVQRSRRSPGTRIALPRQPESTKRYLELCISSGKYTHTLGEIDVSGAQSDRDVFEKIKRKYDELQVSHRICGFFELLGPNGGSFVKFRLDKSPFVAVMTKPSATSVPPPEEVQQGHYDYNPVPMDEPPMPSNVFIHYFTKTTEAHTEPIWSSRLPVKLQESLYYSRIPLTEGWGIEILEGPNWLLFCSSMVLILLFSGVIAALWSHYMADKPTGIAIGAWLTAVQTMTVTSLFFKWTSE